MISKYFNQFKDYPMTESMALTRDEKKNLSATTTEKEWYQVCDKIKIKRNGQYPAYLSREILELYQQKFPPQPS